MNSKTSINDFELKKILGKGSYATVYLGIKKSDKKEYAIKEVNIIQMNELNIKYTFNEIRILASIENEYVVNYIDAFEDSKSSKLYIVLEFLEGGDLESKIAMAKNKNMKFNEDTIWTYAIQILSGLKALEEINIIHRDIKPGNLFLSKDHKTVKLGDLNVSKITPNNLANTQIGTPLYIAPEIWNNENYNSKCDVFSLGCVLYQLAALRVPFMANSLQELGKKILGGFFSRIPVSYSDDLYNFIKSCLEKNQKRRPTITQLLNSHFVTKRMYLIKKDMNSLNKNVNKLLGTINIKKFKLNQINLPKRYNKINRGGSVDVINRKNSKDFRLNKKENIKIDVTKNNNKLPPKPNSKNLPPLPNKSKKYNNINESNNSNNKNRYNSPYNQRNYYPNYNNQNSNNNSKENISKMYGIRNQSPRVNYKKVENYYQAYNNHQKNINYQVNNYKKNKSRISSADVYKRYNDIVSRNRPIWWG